MNTEVIGSGYTKAEIELHVPRSRRTIDRWMKALGMIPDDDGFYTYDDLIILKSLSNWTDRGLKIEKFTRKVHDAN